MSGNTAADREYARIPGYEHYAPPDPLQVLFDNWMKARIVGKSSAQAYKERIADAILFFNHRKLDTWTLEDGKKFIEYLRTKRKNNNNVIIDKIKFLKRVIQFAVDDDILPKMPFNFKRLPKLPKQAIERVPFTWEEHNKLMASIDRSGDVEPNGHYFWPDACRLAWHTGLRVSDVALMPLESILLDKGILRILTQKKRCRKEKLEIPIEPELKPLLIQFLERAKVHGQPFVIPAMQHVYTTQRSGLVKDFRRLCDAVGLVEHSFHSYRHAFITRLINAGVDTLVICELTGNTLKEIQQYAHVSNDAKAKALALSRLAQQQPANVIDIE